MTTRWVKKAFAGGLLKPSAETTKKNQKTQPRNVS